MSCSRILFATALCCLGIAPETRGDSATATIAVSATVKRNCLISTAALAYGAYDPVAANATSPLDATATITLTCTQGTTANIALDGGANKQGTIRRLTNGATGFLTYDLYQDSAHSILWTDSGSGILDAGSAPNKQPRPFPVYGRIAGGQDVPVGSYTDSVLATVNF